MPNFAVNKLELIPNSILIEHESVEFSIRFMEENLLIQYDLYVDIGGFMDTDYPREILSTELCPQNCLNPMVQSDL